MSTSLNFSFTPILGITMIISSLKHVLFITLSCTILSACTTTGDTQPEKSTDYAMQGCIGGGILGLLVSDDDAEDEDKLKNFLAGCSAGAAIGFTVGQRTEAYASANQAMDSEIQRNKGYVVKLQEYNQGLEKNIAIYQEQIDAINLQQLAENDKNSRLHETKNQVAEQAKKAEEALASVNNELNIAKEHLTKYTPQVSSDDTQKWKNEIVSLEKEKDILSSHVQTLSAMNSSI